MIKVILFLLTVLCVGFWLLLTWVNDLYRKIDELEYQMERTQFQLDNINNNSELMKGDKE